MKITQSLLTPNKYSRPQSKPSKITKLAIHYVGNPGSTALANRNYFESLKAGKKNEKGDYIYASSHYIVGLQGEIIQCVPENEIAYCTNTANSYSISIENCHPAADGKFNDMTNASLIELCADICIRYGLDPLKDMIRHFDVNGKKCPLYHVNNPAAWDALKKDVQSKINELKEGEEVTAPISVIINGIVKSVESIQKKNAKGDITNYIKLRDLESEGVSVGYDTARKMPIVDTQTVKK